MNRCATVSVAFCLAGYPLSAVAECPDTRGQNIGVASGGSSNPAERRPADRDLIRAESSDPAAMIAMARRYRDADGVSRNLAKAHYWFNRAATTSREAVDERHALEPCLSAAELAESQRLSLEWLLRPKGKR